jgi:hypothetical protein
MSSHVVILTQTDNPIPEPAQRIAAIARRMGLQPSLVPLAAALRDNAGIAADAAIVVAADTLVAARQANAESIDHILFSAERPVLVYGFCASARHGQLVGHLTDGSLTAVVSLAQGDRTYRIAPDCVAVTGPFTDLNFGPVNPTIDRVFLPESKTSPIESYITIAGHPLFVSCRHRQATVFLTACAQVADIEAPADGPPGTAGIFSSLMPSMMFLRHACAPLCWQSSGRWACLIVDDPILRPRYGFLDFAKLLRRMETHACAMSVATIPANQRATRRAAVELFAGNPDRLSVAVHGCDHRHREFGESNIGRLNEMVATGVRQMAALQRRHGLVCDPVMVFPHGIFSTPAMQVLKRYGYLGAVASVNAFSGAPHPAVANTEPPLRVADFLAPTTTAFDGFPLYLRRYPNAVEDFAFDLFLGKPALITTHHDDFRDGGTAALNLVDRLNSLTPDLRWCGLAAGMRNTCLYRHADDGRLHIRALAREQHLQGFLAAEPACLTMPGSRRVPVTRVTVNGRACPFDESDDRLCVELPGEPGGAAFLKVDHEDASRLPCLKPTMHMRAGSCLRRKLTAFRDIQIMPNRAFAWLADFCQWLETSRPLAAARRR